MHINGWKVRLKYSEWQCQEQVDILISKNQVLQIVYLKHIKLHKLPWIETHKNLITKK